jgi:hypothetical protein
MSAIITDRGVQSSAAALLLLAGGSLIRPVPLWLWTAWAALTVVAVVVAARARR